MLSTLLLIGVTCAPFFVQSGLISLPMLLGSTTPALLLLGAALFVIRGYTITADGLIIHRLFWDTRVPLSGLIQAQYIPKTMSKSMRTCGNGGLYSFTGWYWSKVLGHYHAYVTDLNQTVVLKLEKRTVVISPDDPEDFVEALKPHLPTTPP